ncbi:hypothetical protein SAMN05216532_5190 [Streptomyces sp. 2231.1]|nr:hypothetical protein SAMN05216532_5190 [Streptomyces sp. 2231.1]
MLCRPDLPARGWRPTWPEGWDIGPTSPDRGVPARTRDCPARVRTARTVVTRPGGHAVLWPVAAAVRPRPVSPGPRGRTGRPGRSSAHPGDGQVSSHPARASPAGSGPAGAAELAVPLNGGLHAGATAVPRSRRPVGAVISRPRPRQRSGGDRQPWRPPLPSPLRALPSRAPVLRPLRAEGAPPHGHRVAGPAVSHPLPRPRRPTLLEGTAPGTPGPPRPAPCFRPSAGIRLECCRKGVARILPWRNTFASHSFTLRNTARTASGFRVQMLFASNR